MKKVWCFFAVLALIFSLSACQEERGEENSLSAESSVPLIDVESEETESSVQESSVEQGEWSGEVCLAHKYLYHAYSSQLLDYVGYENFEAWGQQMRDKPNEEVNIVSFVEYFQIPKETLIKVERANYTEDFAEYDGVTMLSLEQIEAIYSGDKKRINETFCGPLAFVNESDGELYSIYWLAEHTAEDYLKAGLPLEKVEEVVRGAEAESNTEILELAKKARAALEDAWVKNGSALETSDGGQNPCMEHTFSYHTITGELIKFVGAEKFDAWVTECSDDEMNISNFVEEFQIPKEDFSRIIQESVEPMSAEEQEAYREEFGFTEKQIEALYSGNQAAVNEAFCGKLAFFNEMDGELYSIYWLAKHTAEDYLETGLPLEKVEEVVRAAEAETNTKILELAKKARAALEKAKTLEG